MSRYIDVNAVIRRKYKYETDPYTRGWNDALEVIKTFEPTAEAIPIEWMLHYVRDRGRWISIPQMIEEWRGCRGESD